MRIMYVGSTPLGQSDLMLDSEITELQQVFRECDGEPIDFVSFPRLPIEMLPLRITDERPDILHLAAHGTDGVLALANADGAPVPLTGEGLRTYLDIENPPKLVYLNGCNSQSIAKEVAKLVSLAIGTTQAISNRTARASAVLFYKRLICGQSVEQAFEAGRVTIEAMQRDTVSSELFHRKDCVPTNVRLYQTPRIIARFINDKYKPKTKSGRFEIEFGVIGCPFNSAQIVLFSDATSDVTSKKNLAKQICSVVRASPVHGVVWDSDNPEMIYGDYRIFACGTTTAGKTFTVASTVCEALEGYFQFVTEEIPTDARKAIAQLRKMDGSL